MMLRGIAIIVGIVLSATGGVITYRAFFIEPSAAVLVSSEGVRQLPNTFSVIEGIVLLVVGAAIAFAVARKKPKQ